MWVLKDNAKSMIVWEQLISSISGDIIVKKHYTCVTYLTISAQMIYTLQ